MADRRVNDLSYGQLGQACFDVESQQWLFNRRTGSGAGLRLLERSSTAVSRSVDAPFALENESRLHARKASMALVRSNPELAPAFEDLMLHGRASEVVTARTVQHDSTKSALFAFGRARDIDNQASGARTVPILALVSGSAGETLRLLQIRNETHLWGGHHGTRLDMPTFEHGENSVWPGNGSPIRQVYFSDSEAGAGSWLWVRLHTSTVVLRPLLHRIPVSLPGPAGKIKPSKSRLDPNPVITLPIELTGGSPHADVAINPWYQNQIAVLDQVGRWSVWEVQERRHLRVIKDPELFAKGEISESTPKSPNSDGWGRVCWAGNVSTLVVGNRRRLVILDLNSTPTLRVESLDFDLAKTSHWILDMKRSPVNSNHLFVLTSSQLFWLGVTGDDRNRRENLSRTTGLQIILSWRHFRDVEDVGLQLEIMSLRGVLFISLFSPSNNLVSVFEFLAPEGSLIAYSVADPFNLHIPSELWEDDSHQIIGAVPNTTRRMLGLTYLPLEYTVLPRFKQSDLGQEYMERGIVFVKAMMLMDDLSLRTCMYAAVNTVDEKPSRGNHTLDDIQLPTRDTTLPRGMRKTATRVVEDDFVVDDGELEDDSGSESEHRPLENISRRRFKRSTESKVRHDGNLQGAPTVDFSWVHQKVFREGLKGKVTSPRTVVKTEHRDSDEQVEQLRKTLSAKLNTKRQFTETLTELLSTIPDVSDIDQTSVEVDSMLRSLGGADAEEASALKLESTRLITPPFIGLPLSPGNRDSEDSMSATEAVSLSTIYDHLVATWISPLPRDVSGKTRVMMERNVRSTALMIYLSSIGVSLKSTTAPAAATPGPSRTGSLVKQEEQELHLPVRSKAGEGPPSAQDRRHSPLSTISSLPSSSQPLPAPPQSSDPTLYSSPRITPSAVQLPSPTPTLSAGSQSTTAQESPASARLRAYTHLAPQAPLPSNLSTILAHWSLGSDPHAYAYTATSRALDPLPSDESGPDDDDSRSQDPSQRWRFLRHREKKQKASRRRPGEEARLLSSSQPGAAGEASLRPWGSQPAPRGGTGGVGSSQLGGLTQGTTGTMPMPMSQVERGVFGGRAGTKTEKAKKRKRDAGF